MLAKPAELVAAVPIDRPPVEAIEMVSLPAPPLIVPIAVNAALVWVMGTSSRVPGPPIFLVEGTMARWFSEDYMAADPDECNKVRDMIRNTKVLGFCGCCRAIQGLDLTDRISTITVPTQMIVGEDDPGTPVAAHEVMHEKIEGSELVVIPNALHFSNVEQKDAFNDAYMAFLGKHS